MIAVGDAGTIAQNERVLVEILRALGCAANEEDDFGTRVEQKNDTYEGIRALYLSRPKNNSMPMVKYIAYLLINTH